MATWQTCFAASDVTPVYDVNSGVILSNEKSVFTQLAATLICCKTGLNVGGKTRNICFAAMLQNKLHVFPPFLPYLKVYLSFVDSIRCLSQSRCLVLQWRNYYNSQLIRRMLNLPFPERPCLEWVRLCRDCTRPFWPRMAELILSWENIIVAVLHLFTGTDCFYRKNFLAFSMSKMRQLSAWEHVNLNNYHRGHTISSTYNFPSLWHFPPKNNVGS